MVLHFASRPRCMKPIFQNRDSVSDEPTVLRRWLEDRYYAIRRTGSGCLNHSLRPILYAEAL